MTDGEQLLDKARAELGRVFGFPGFRPGQEEVIGAALRGEDVLAVMPTGSGKSLCYQLPAMAREGLALVVSPLIALMRDQVAQLRELGVSAAALNSASDIDERQRVAEALRNRSLRLLYVAPERLVREDMIALLRNVKIDLFAIDEAHCVSQWGHDFRPEYLRLRDIAQTIGAQQTIAVTATADGPTRADIVSRLFTRSPRIFVRSFDRPNLFLAMRPKGNATRQLTERLEAHKGESGIIYCASRRRTEELAEEFSGRGRRALPYHAGLDHQTRARNQDEFLQNDGIIVCATIAFGMGIDKPDVRFVFHADMPSSIEAYYQEITTCRARRPARRHVYAVRRGRHRAAPPADRRRQCAGRAQAHRGKKTRRPCGALRIGALPASGSPRDVRRRGAGVRTLRRLQGQRAADRREARCAKSDVGGVADVGALFLRTSRQYSGGQGDRRRASAWSRRAQDFRGRA